MLGDCEMGTCRACFRRASTSSGSIKYCEACSALYGICDVCGVNKDGRHYRSPVVTKMLSSQNGRGGRKESSDDEDDGCF